MNKRITEQTPELEALKEQATELGIKFHPNIGFDKLQFKVNEKLIDIANGEEIQRNVVNTEKTEEPTGNRGKMLTPNEVEKMIRDEALELVRVRVTCMNPNKSEWEGEIFTVGNSKIPAQKKYVPFNIEEGWHIPRIMLTMLEDRKYQAFINERDHRGRQIRRGVLKKEFNIEVMPPMTSEEIKDLRAKQALAAGKVD